MSTELFEWNLRHEDWHYKLNTGSEFTGLTAEEKEVLAVLLAFRGMSNVTDKHLIVQLKAFGITGDIFEISDAELIKGVIEYLAETYGPATE